MDWYFTAHKSESATCLWNVNLDALNGLCMIIDPQDQLKNYLVNYAPKKMEYLDNYFESRKFILGDQVTINMDTPRI